MELSGEKRIWGARIARGWALRTPQWGRDTRSLAHLGEKELPGGLLGKPGTPGRERIARWPVGNALHTWERKNCQVACWESLRWLEACSKHFAGVHIWGLF